MPEIDDLTIRINTDAAKASANLDKLVRTLSNMSATLRGMDTHGLSQFERALENITRHSSGLKSTSLDISSLANALKKFTGLDSSGLQRFANDIKKTNSILSGMADVGNNAESLATLASSISRLGYKRVTNAVSNLSLFTAEFKKMMQEVSKAPAVSKNLIDFTNALANLASQGSKVGTASNSLINAINGTHRASGKASKSTFSLARAFGKFYASYFLVIRGIKGLWSSINTTADYVESFNYYTVAFGKIASKWDKDWDNYGSENARNYSNSFVTTMNETFSKLSGVSYDPQTGLLSESGLKNLGLNLQEVTQYAAQLASMMDAVGQSGQTTLATTDAFVKLAGDISSLYNIDYSEASSALRSVMQGQSRAGYKFGWDTTMAALQTTADKFDLSKPVSEMTQMEKQQLRILTILEQSKVAWGDQANTMSSLSNQIRLFKNNMAEAGMMLGQLFTPMLTSIMPVINGVSIAIKRLLGDIAGLLGIELNPEDFSQGYNEIEDDFSGISDELDSVAESAKRAKAGIRGFDELNVISSGSSPASDNESGMSTIDLTSEILNATEQYNSAWNEAYSKMESRADEFANTVSGYLQPINNIFEGISIGDYFSVGENISGFVSDVFSFMTNAISSVDWNSIGLEIGNFLSGIDWTGMLQNVGQFIWAAIDASIDLWKGMFEAEPIAATIITAMLAVPLLSKAVGSITSIFGTVAGIFETVGTAFSIFGTFLSSLSAPVLIFTGLIAGLAVGLGYVLASNEEVKKGFNDAVNVITESFAPAVSLITETVLPSLKKGWEGVKELLEPFTTFLKNAFTDVWIEIINPALMYVGETIIPMLISAFENLWKNVIEPFGNFLKSFFAPAIEVITSLLEMLWENAVLPLVDAVGTLLSKAFENISEILNKTLIPVVSRLIGVFNSLWENFLKPIVNFLWTTLKPAFEQVTKSIGGVISGITRSIGGIIDFVGGSFSLNWSKAWKGVVDTFGGIWETIASVAKSPINLVIGLINGMIDAIENGINFIVDGINKLSFDVPDWVPGIGGETFGFSIDKVRFSDIPYLANGGMVNSGSLFFAGEKKAEILATERGRTSVLPIEKLTDSIGNAVYSAVSNAMGGYRGNSSSPEVRVFIGNKEIGEAAVDYIKEVSRPRQKLPFPLYTN